jgi:glycine cleavage system H protein
LIFSLFGTCFDSNFFCFTFNPILAVFNSKSVSDIYAPVSGTVTAVNEALSTQPELLNSDPYGAGWICEITIEGEAPGLLGASDYEALLAG